MGLQSASGGLTKSKLELATAVPGDVVASKTFYAGDKELQTGLIPNYGHEPLASKCEIYNPGSGNRLYLYLPNADTDTESRGGFLTRSVCVSAGTAANALHAVSTASRVANGTVRGDCASGSVTFTSVVNGIYFICLTSHSSGAGTITLPSGCSWLWHETATGSRDGDVQRSYGMNIGIFRTSSVGSKTINYQVGYDYAAGIIKIAKLN